MSFDLKIENNNLTLNPDGTLQTVRDNEKLAQDVIKIILTPVGSNRFHKWYGSTVGARTIGEILPAALTQADSERAIQNSLNNLIALQRAQSRAQYVSPGETIDSIKDIFASRNNSDPRQYQIVVSVITRQLTIVEETFTLNV